MTVGMSSGAARRRTAARDRAVVERDALGDAERAARK